MRTADELLTQAQVEEAIYDLMDRQETATLALGDLALQAAEAEVEFKKAYAMVYAATSGTVEDRKQEATLITIDAFKHFKLRSVVHSTQQELLRTIRSQLDSLRTIAVNIRGVS